MGIQRVKARGSVGSRKMEVGFVGHDIGEPGSAGIRELDFAVADNRWKAAAVAVAVAGLAKYALVLRIGVGLGQGTAREHCVVQMAVAKLRNEVGFA